MGVHATLGAQSPKDLYQAGELYFEVGRYEAALDHLLAYQKYKPKDKSAKLLIARAYIAAGNPEEALRYLRFLEDKRRTPDEVYYYMGRVYHLQQDYRGAVKWYKRYLTEADDKDRLRPRTKHYIRQAAAGIRMQRLPEQAEVSNLGPNVNSSGDDYAPLPSPNYGNTLYFSSMRPDNAGELRDSEGYRDDILGQYSSDIFVTRLINGGWTATEPLDPLLNSPRHDRIVGFTNGAQVLYFFKGLSRMEGQIYTDTFSADNSNYVLPGLFTPPYPEGARFGGLQFFNDTLVVFSVELEGGAGGLDLYYATRDAAGRWSSPESFGSAINTPFDERDPFLAVDGRQVYFASDRPESMGGYDIFTATFSDKSLQWERPANLGAPINSPSDELGYSLSTDGLKGYFSSDRVGGSGGQDLHIAYYRERQKQQLVYSDPLVFWQVRPYEEDPDAIIGLPTDGREEDFDAEQLTYVSIAPLNYTEDNILTPANRRELDDLLKLMGEFPQLRVELIAHVDNSGPERFHLYFSYKKAETAAQYLIDNGLRPDRIYLKGVGSAYPLATNTTSQGDVNTIGQTLNRRIDIRLRNVERVPVKVTYSGQQISPVMRTEVGDRFDRINEGLTYRVQVAALGSMYDSDLILRYPDAMVERIPGSPMLRYMVGAAETYSAAETLRNSLQRDGVAGAFIVPYINGIRTTKEAAEAFSSAYPDLINFLRSN